MICTQKYFRSNRNTVVGPLFSFPKICKIDIQVIIFRDFSPHLILRIKVEEPEIEKRQFLQRKALKSARPVPPPPPACSGEGRRGHFKNFLNSIVDACEARFTGNSQPRQCLAGDADSRWGAVMAFGNGLCSQDFWRQRADMLLGGQDQDQELGLKAAKFGWRAEQQQLMGRELKI